MLQGLWVPGEEFGGGFVTGGGGDMRERGCGLWLCCVVGWCIVVRGADVWLRFARMVVGARVPRDLAVPFVCQLL